tara:strand:+ start:3359 stop:3490 length:132 start_codon:yes stop_codon:yes gene_type:complete
MTTYLARSKDGRTAHISAYTYSDAFQQANDWAGDSMLESCNEI